MAEPGAGGQIVEETTMNEPTEEDTAKAEEMKEKANQLFKDKQYFEAISYYSKAIDYNPKNAIYYGNRSFANLKIENFGLAIKDADQAIALDRGYIKGYYRRASARLMLGRVKEAFKDYETVHKRRPNDKDAKVKYLECKKLVTQMNFQNAIAVESNTSVSDEINLETMTIEDDYDGPRLEDGNVTLEFMKELMVHYKNQKKLHKKYAYKILLDVKKYFMDQPSLVNIDVPAGEKFTVCGDIHGQFYDLMNIFDLNGIPSEKNPYLFNGDFVDRGSFSVECIFVLFGFKLLYKDHFFMSRGNHETITMNQMYGFEGEVRSKYSPLMSNLFTEVYNWLPLCHCIKQKILVMHGGLFSEDIKLSQIQSIYRNRQPPDEGPMCELLWSDPMEEKGYAPSKRGVGIMFGPDVTEKFLKLNDLDYIIRSHEVKPEGYEVTHNRKCITVFSAPNYLDSVGNKGAFVILNGSDLTPKFTTFECVPHPPVVPMAFASNNMFSKLLMGSG